MKKIKRRIGRIVLSSVLCTSMLVCGAFAFAGCSAEDIDIYGKSAYEIAVENGFSGTEQDWLNSMKGADGEDGKDGQTPYIGANGNWWIGETDTTVKASGANGANGTNGVDGKSAYELAVAAGFEGDEEAWLESLKGSDGTNGADGANGTNGQDGASIVGAEWVSNDKWGISTQFVFYLSNNTQITTPAKIQIYPSLTYTADTLAEVNQLVNYGVEYDKIDFALTQGNVEVATEEDFINALFVGTQSVVLTNDITIDIAGEIDAEASIDLNGHKLTNTNTQTLSIVDGGMIEIKNGELEFNCIDRIQSCIFVGAESYLRLVDVNYTAKGTAIYPCGTAHVSIQNCNITGGTYGVATNANVPANYNPQIEIINSTIISTGFSETDNDDAAVLINVPAEVRIVNSTIQGNRQGLIVRGGAVLVEDSTIRNTCGYANKTEFTNSNWRDGNNMPMAGIVLGNRNTKAYQYPAMLKLVNTEIVVDDESVPTIYAWGNNPTEEEYEFRGAGLVYNIGEENMIGLNNAVFNLDHNVAVVGFDANALDEAKTISTLYNTIAYNHYSYDSANEENNFHTIAEIKNDLKIEQDFYKVVLDLKNFGEVYSVQVGDSYFFDGQEIKISIGQKNFIKDKAFYVEDGKLYVASIILATETLDIPTISINGVEFQFNNQAFEQLEVTNVAFAGELTGSPVSTVIAGPTENEYYINVNSGTEILFFDFVGKDVKDIKMSIIERREEC